MSKLFKVSFLVFFGLILVILLYLSFSLNTKANATQHIDVPQNQLKIFTQVLGIVRSQYVNKEPLSKLIVDATKGMVTSLDPHSEFLTPKEYKSMQVSMKGHFGGLGIMITQKDGLLTVVSVLPQTPASKAGIKAGDVILKINKISTFRMDLEKVINILRGKPGTYVKLTIARKGLPNPLVFNIKREIIHIKNVDSKMIGNIGYIKIVEFRDHTAKAVKDAIRKLNKEGAKGLILDLRDNPGGLLYQAKKVSNLFINEGIIVSVKGRNKDNDQIIYAKNEPIFKEPMVIIINSGTASAAEIVTGCLKDHKRAVVIGQRSFGKGNVQDVIPMSNGYALILTVAKYYTPNGFSIQAQGVMPNIDVKKENKDDFTLRESDLLHHLTSKKAILQKPNEILIDKNKKTHKHLKNEFVIKEAMKVLDYESDQCPSSAKICYSYPKG